MMYYGRGEAVGSCLPATNNRINGYKEEKDFPSPEDD